MVSAYHGAARGRPRQAIAVQPDAIKNGIKGPPALCRRSLACSRTFTRLPWARAEQARLCRLFEIVWCGVPRTSAGASGVGGFKTAMRGMGIIAGNTMARPQRSLNAEESARVEAIVRGVGLLS